MDTAIHIYKMLFACKTLLSLCQREGLEMLLMRIEIDNIKETTALTHTHLIL